MKDIEPTPHYPWSAQQLMAVLAPKLTPQAVIRGRIMDDEGEPVANAQVALQSYRYT